MVEPESEGLIDDPFECVMHFARRFGPAHVQLAAHSAVLTALTPELVHLIRVNFVREAPFIAEADLLLSLLCRESGGEYYEVDTGARDVLLDQLSRAPGFGPARLREVGKFVSQYSARMLEGPLDTERRAFFETQEWVGIAYAEPAFAEEVLAKELARASGENNKGEVRRLVRLTGLLDGALQGAVALRRYVRALESMRLGDVEHARAVMEPLGGTSSQVIVRGVSLPAVAKQDPVQSEGRPDPGPTTHGMTAGMQRAAVLIGVANTGHLPTLQAAHQAVETIRAWALLQGMGDRVVTLTDATGQSVSADDIKRAIRRFIERGTIEQLFVYFAGHAVNLRFHEYWLLSDAPDDPQAAVNVDGSVSLARYCGIPHVVFISDSCRTAAESIQAMAIEGSSIFPNFGPRDVPGSVDVFYGTAVGRPAYEVRDPATAAAGYHGVYTQALVDGLSGARAELLEVHASTARVHPWQLKRFLQLEVPMRLAKLGVTASQSQTPDAVITSEPEAWLSELTFPLVAAPTDPERVRRRSASGDQFRGRTLTRELVLVHGRAPEFKDAVALKKEWIDSLKEGLHKSGLELPIPDDRVRFPYVGQVLFDLVPNVASREVVEIIMRRSPRNTEEQEFIAGVLDEVREQKGITDDQVRAAAQAAGAARGESGAAGRVERGSLDWGWMQGIVSAIDRHVPGGSGASIALFTRDVYYYLTNQALRATIDAGVRQAMTPAVESIVVGHSLGAVVSYNLLRAEGAERGWRVPLYVTLGSPLAVTKIRRALSPIKHPQCVSHWFNAMDPDDLVALYPMDDTYFPVSPRIENRTDVRNQTPNQHGITGYLNDKSVAKRIHDALVAEQE